MSLTYSRVTPFGFLDTKTATDEDNYYGEVVHLPMFSEKEVLDAAVYLRAMFKEADLLQRTGGDSSEQASLMALLLTEGLNRG